MGLLQTPELCWRNFDLDRDYDLWLSKSRRDPAADLGEPNLHVLLVAEHNRSACARATGRPTLGKRLFLQRIQATNPHLLPIRSRGYSRGQQARVIAHSLIYEKMKNNISFHEKFINKDPNHLYFRHASVSAKFLMRLSSAAGLLQRGHLFCLASHCRMMTYSKVCPQEVRSIGEVIKAA